MKVKELIQLLNEIDPNIEVILQKDSEGNAYSPLRGIDSNAVYIAKNSYSGDVYNLNWNCEDADMDSDEWESLKQNNPCLVLFPIN